MTVDLYWIPLGAGGHLVAFNGRLFEALAALRARRPPCPLYHAALLVEAGGARYAIELAPASAGAVVTGPVGARWAGRWRIFRYELRSVPGGTIPDLGFAVGGAHAVTTDPAVAELVVAQAARVPRLTWGRDEAGTGEMWNSNSVIAWLLASAGLPASELQPPAGGRAPGWDAGVELARRPLRQRRQGGKVTGSGRAALTRSSAARALSFLLARRHRHPVAHRPMRARSLLLTRNDPHRVARRPEPSDPPGRS